MSLIMFFTKKIAIKSIQTLFVCTIATHTLATPSLELNWPQAIELTLSKNPTLNSFRYELEKQEGVILEAKQTPAAHINIELEDVLGSGETQGFNALQSTLSVSWILEGELRQHFIRVSQAGYAQLTSSLQLQQLNAIEETTQRYIMVLAHQARLQNADEALSLADEGIAAIKKRVRAAKSPEAELFRTQVTREQHRLQREDIQHELDSALHALAAQWGELKPQFQRVTGAINDIPAIKPLEQLRTELTQSAQYNRFRSERTLKHTQLQLAKAQSTPNWEIEVGIRNIESTHDQAFVGSLRIPFGRITNNKGRILQAQSELAQIDAKESALHVQAQTSLFLLYQELQHSLHRIESYQTRIIPQLENALKATKRAYDLGRYSYLEWQTVQTETLLFLSTPNASHSTQLTFLGTRIFKVVPLKESSKESSTLYLKSSPFAA